MKTEIQTRKSKTKNNDLYQTKRTNSQETNLVVNSCAGTPKDELAEGMVERDNNMK